MALQRGNYRTFLVDDEKGIYGFTRESKEEKVLVLINNGCVEQRISLEDGREVVCSAMQGKIVVI